MMPRPVSHAQALEALSDVTALCEQLDHLYATGGDRRDLIGKAQHQLGVALKVAGVYAELAVAEAVSDFLDDLNDAPPAGLADRVLRLIDSDLEAIDAPTLAVPDGVVVTAQLCGQCNREAVTFPPPRCAEHGGLS